MNEVIERVHKNPITPQIAVSAKKLLLRQLDQTPHAFPQKKLLESAVLSENPLKTLNIYSMSMAIAVSIALARGRDDDLIQFATSEVTEHHRSFAEQKGAVARFFTRHHIPDDKQELIFAEDELLRKETNADIAFKHACAYLDTLTVGS